MLNIFTDNWDKLPTLNEGEHLLRIITDNIYDELYVIVDEDMDADDEIRRALRHKFGSAVCYGGYLDMEYMYEAMEDAKSSAEDAWDGESYYIICWSDGGMDWTSNGPVWFDTIDELADELLAASNSEGTDTHLPYARMVERFDEDAFMCYFGDFADDFDLEAIIDETTVCINGNLWNDTFGEDFDEVVKRHEK